MGRTSDIGLRLMYTALSALAMYSLREQVFSKLESGRVPSIDELIDLLEAAKGLPPTFEQRSRI